MMHEKIDNLIQKHGKRIKPKPETIEQARNNVQAHWQAVVEKNKAKKRKIMLFKIAASLFVVLSIGIGLISQYPTQTQAPVALLAYTQGKIEISADQKSWQTLQSGQPLSQGMWIKSAASAVANVRLNDKSELRMNASTLIRINKPSEIELLHGQIYHDADYSDHSIAVKIKTKFADIQHIGTRYAVKVGENLQVTVRNGEVKIKHDHQDSRLESQQQLTLKADGSSKKSMVTSYDENWRWTQLAAQPFELKDKNLHQFIKWFAHEHGYKIDWNGEEIDTQAVKLNGTIGHISQNDLIKTVFLSTQYKYQINEGVLHILK